MVRVFASSIQYYVLNIRFGLNKDCKIGTYKLVLTILSLLHAVFQISGAAKNATLRQKR
jgi:hypothetical protein